MDQHIEIVEAPRDLLRNRRGQLQGGVGAGKRRHLLSEERDRGSGEEAGNDEGLNVH
jgi:hypothetical protein